MQILKPFIDFIYPPTCVVCECLLDDGERHICLKCWNSIPRLSPGNPLFMETRGRILAEGLLSELVSVFVFEKSGAFQSLAHVLKYEGFQSVGRMVGRELGKAILERNIQADAILPVPLHRSKERERGFNQSEQIALGMSGVTGIAVQTRWLKRTRSTQTQTQLTLEERKKNVQDAFAMTERGMSEASEKRVIIVDDVITTGSTIISCAQALTEAGALQITAASVALAE